MAAYASAYAYAYYSRYVGKWVVCRCTSGTYRGVLHRVTGDGLYLARATAVAVSGTKTDVPFEHADNPGAKQADTEQVFFPFFFIPFAGLTGFSPFFWW